MRRPMSEAEEEHLRAEVEYLRSIVEGMQRAAATREKRILLLELLLAEQQSSGQVA